MSLCEAAEYLTTETLPHWYSKWVAPHEHCYEGQLNSVDRCLDIWYMHPWSAFISPTGTGKGYMIALAAQRAHLQLLTVTAANAIGEHHHIINEYASPDVEDAHSGAISYDVLSFNNSTQKHNNIKAKNAYLIYEDGEYRPTAFFKRIAKEYGWCLSIDEIQKTKNAINYSYAVRTLVVYIVKKFSRALQYDDDDMSPKAIKARYHAKSRVVFASFCPFDDVKQLKTFCWLSGIFDELPNMDLVGKKFLKEIAPLIEVAREHGKRKVGRLIEDPPSSKAAAYKLIYDLTHILWRYIAISTIGVNIPYSVEYYDMFYEIPKEYRKEATKILKKIDSMNQRKGGSDDRLISELKNMEELMIRSGIHTSLAKRLLKSGYRTVIGVDFNGYINKLKQDMTDAGYEAKVITGAVTGRHRKELSDKFKQNEFDVMILNKDAGAEGIGLQNLSDDTLNSAAFDMADHKFQKQAQFSGRLVRLGMKGDVIIICLYPYVKGADVETLYSVVKSMKKKHKAARPFMQDDLGVIKLPGEYTPVDKNFNDIKFEQ